MNYYAAILTGCIMHLARPSRTGSQLDNEKVQESQNWCDRSPGQVVHD